MPAPSIGEYLTNEQERAAVVVQSWWKGVLARKKIARFKQCAKRENSAVIIQRATRRYLHSKGIDRHKPKDSFQIVSAPTADKKKKLVIDAACINDQLSSKSQQPSLQQQQEIWEFYREYI